MLTDCHVNEREVMIPGAGWFIRREVSSDGIGLSHVEYRHPYSTSPLRRPYSDPSGPVLTVNAS